MVDLYQHINEAAAYLKSIASEWSRTAIVMGSGLSEIFEDAELVREIPYGDIPYFPTSTVLTHSGKMLLYRFQDRPVVVLAGRWHYYEGYSAKEITFPIRVLKAIGIDTVIFTNVSGGVNPTYETGDIVIINDHINMIPDHPLRGQNDNRLGLRFPDMLHTYDEKLQRTAVTISTDLGIETKSGVYLALQGPSLETPAEYTMAYRIGADMIGMSTVPEVIVAKHSDLRIAAISIISNVCYPADRITETTMEEVVEVAQKSGEKLAKILYALVQKI